MALTAAVDDAKPVLVTIDNLHDTVLVEVEQGHGRLPRLVSVRGLPLGLQAGLRMVLHRRDTGTAQRGLIVNVHELQIAVAVNISHHRVSDSLGIVAVDEQNVAINRIVRVDVGGVRIGVGGAVYHHQHVQLPVHVEVGHRHIAVLRNPTRNGNGLHFGHTVERNIGAADDGDTV